MAPRRIRIELFLVSAALAGALAATPGLAAWVHPAVSGVGSSTAPRIIVNPPVSKTLNASATNPNLSAKSSGTAISVGSSTSTTSTSVAANGSSITTTKTVTTYATPSSIVVTVSLTPTSGPTVTHTFTFPNLNAGPQTFSILQGLYTVTATPNATGDDVGITYGPYFSASAYAMTLNLTPPAPTTTSTSTTPTAPNSSSPPAPQSVPSPMASFEPEDPVAEALTLSHVSQTAIEACNTNTLPCIADALDAYADRLEALTPRLPARLSALPTIVREAARKVRAAKSKTEAVNAVKSAITQVNKTIALLRAEDPNAARTGVPVGRAVDQTLEVAEVKLLRSTGL